MCMHSHIAQMEGWLISYHVDSGAGCRPTFQSRNSRNTYTCVCIYTHMHVYMYARMHRLGSCLQIGPLLSKHATQISTRRKKNTSWRVVAGGRLQRLRTCTRHTVSLTQYVQHIRHRTHGGLYTGNSDVLYSWSFTVCQYFVVARMRLDTVATVDAGILQACGWRRRW